MTHVYDAIILGAGYGGLGLAAKLKIAGIDNFVVLERADDIGGVWRDNTYPGAACDTQSVIYCYRFFPNHSVSSLFIGQSELLDYLRRLSSAFDVDPHIRLNAEVISAEWVDGAHLWKVTCRDGSVYHALMFAPAWGQLGTPSIPDIPGRDDFGGAQFHSARWDHSVRLEGRAVASIGAAASAVQYVPEVAKSARHLTVFQRSANYILPRNQHIFTADESADFAENPESFARLRDEIHEMREAGFARTRVGTEAAEIAVAEARAHLEAQIEDVGLRHKLTPDYEFGCKRILRSDDYYPAIARPNVTLETERIERIVADGICTVDGVLHPADVIIWGTGFHSQSFQGRISITGRNGADLRKRWATSPEAYLGIWVDGFPNLAMVYGPNTNLNHNSIVSMLELQDDHIVSALQHIIDSRDVLDVRRDALREFNERVQDELASSAYSSDCTSWYKNAEGKVINNWSGTVGEYASLVGRLDRDAFQAA